MRKQNYLDRAKLNPASTFKSPMDVVETDDIDLAAKLAILKAWEADERVSSARRRRRDGWRRACTSSQGASGPCPTWQGPLLDRDRADPAGVLIGRDFSVSVERSRLGFSAMLARSPGCPADVHSVLAISQ